MNTQHKSIIGMIVGLGLVVLFMVVWGGSAAGGEPMPVPAVDPEETQLVGNIGSGALLWQQAKAQVDAGLATMTKTEGFVRGYRLTLCTKFGKIVTPEGTVRAANPGECELFQ